MVRLSEIKGKIEEFNQYIENIDLEELSENYTRKELEQFVKDVYRMDSPSIASKVSNLTKEMKIAEYPQLLGVHHFPVLENIPFLTDDEKIGLDKYLVRLHVGDYVFGLWRIVDQEKSEKLQNWLEENGVIENQYFVRCPHCHDEVLTVLTEDEKRKIDDQNREQTFQFLFEKIYSMCMECEMEIDIDSIEHITYEPVYKMKMERDTSLDHV